MCSTCNIKDYKSNPETGILIMPLGISEEVRIHYDVSSRKYYLSTGNAKSNFLIYRCPTCGKKLF